VKFDWTEFLTLAKELAARPDEAARRSAVSRAYYSVLGQARTLFDARGEVSATVQAATLWKVLQEKGDAPRREIGVSAGRLRGKRNRADYDPTVQGLENLVKSSLLEAEHLISMLAKI
jgi:uncharacterized protein (UPF0332 family)